MSIKSRMTAIADRIRSILGISGSMGLEDMASNLQMCKNEVDLQENLLSIALTALEGKASGGTGSSDVILQNKQVTPSTANQLITPDTGYNGLSYVSVAGDSDLTPDNIKAGVNIFGVDGSYVGNIGTDPVLQDKVVTPTEDEQLVTPDVGYDGLSSVSINPISGWYIGSQIEVQEAETYTPGTEDQSIPVGKYLSGTQTILGDKDLIPENIKNGIDIFGVTGSFIGENNDGIDTSDATATSSDIAEGKTAYVNGVKITGSLEDISTYSNYAAEYNEYLISGERYLGLVGEYPYGGYVPVQGSVEIEMDMSEFGDASQNDVAAGVKFTSREGLCLTGTREFISNGGIDTSDSTATADDLADGKTAYSNGEKITGTLKEVTSGNGYGMASDSEFFSINSPKKFSMLAHMDTKRIWDIGSFVNIEMSASKLGNAQPEDVAVGKTFTSEGGLRLTGTREFVYSGLDTSDATATADDIASGKTAYSNGEKITGTLEEVSNGFGYGLSASNTSIYTAGDKKWFGLSAPMAGKKIWHDGSYVDISIPASNLGNAKTSDVAAGVTFTSENGIKMTGAGFAGLPTGISKVSYGTYVCDSSGYDVITHNHGDIPDIFVLTAIGDIDCSDNDATNMMVSCVIYNMNHYGLNVTQKNDTGHLYQLAIVSYPYSTGYYASSSSLDYANSLLTATKANTDFKKFKAGIEYKWMCFSFEH